MRQRQIATRIPYTPVHSHRHTITQQRRMAKRDPGLLEYAKDDSLIEFARRLHEARRLYPAIPLHSEISPGDILRPTRHGYVGSGNLERDFGIRLDVTTTRHGGSAVHEGIRLRTDIDYKDDFAAVDLSFSKKGSFFLSYEKGTLHQTTLGIAARRKLEDLVSRERIKSPSFIVTHVERLRGARALVARTSQAHAILSIPTLLAKAIEMAKNALNNTEVDSEKAEASSKSARAERGKYFSVDLPSNSSATFFNAIRAELMYSHNGRVAPLAPARIEDFLSDMTRVQLE